MLFCTRDAPTSTRELRVGGVHTTPPSSTTTRQQVGSCVPRTLRASGARTARWI
jgi:hypothetical protein